MSRLIDANAVVKAILEERDKIPRTVPTAPYELGTEKPFRAGDQMRGGIRKALRCIEQATTVDAVPVVRCKDCTRCVMYRGVPFCNKWRTFPDIELNDFCSYGERKEGDDNEP